MIEIKEITTRREFESLAGIWNDFLARSGNENIFLTWEWISEWVDIYLDDDQLFCLTVYDDDNLAAIIPLWTEKIRFGGFLNLRALSLLGSNEVCPDYLDLIVRKKNPYPIINSVWDHLFGKPGKKWDVFKFYNVPFSSNALNKFYNLSESDDRCIKRVIEGYTVCPYVRLPDSWDEYLAGLSSNQRRLYLISERKIGAKGELKLKICKHENMLAEEMDGLKVLNRRSWAERGLPGSFSTKNFESFHRRVAKRFMKEGRLFLCSLWLSDRLIGSYYGFIYGNVSYYYIIGVERDLVKGASVGRILLGRCIKESIERGCREFDLLRGDEQYKYDWTNLDRKNLSLSFYNKSFRSFIFILYNFLSEYLKQIFKRLLGKRYKSVKRIFRRPR